MKTGKAAEILIPNSKKELLATIKEQFNLTKGLSRKTKEELSTIYLLLVESAGIDDDLKILKPKQSIPERQMKSDDISTKSDIVRKILSDLNKTGLKYTSGTVIKILSEQYGLKIHRSFCCTIIKKWRDENE